MRIAQGKLRRGGCYFKPAWYVRRVAPRAPYGGADALGLWPDVRGVYKEEQHCPLLGHLFVFCVHHPGNNTMGRRLLQRDLVRGQGGSQGSGGCGRCIGPSVGANGRRRSSTRGGVTGPHFAKCVFFPGHSATGRRLLRTSAVCAQGGPQGPKKSGRCFGPLTGCTGVYQAPKNSNLTLFDHFFEPCVRQHGHSTMAPRLL